MQKSPILQNPIYPRKSTDLTDFTDLTDLQTYRFLVDRSRTISAPGPTRARARSTTRSVAARRGALARVVQERGVDSFPRAHARGGLGRRGLVCTCSSGVLSVGCGGAGLRSCWEAGPRARTHAESIDLMTKSAYFRRQSGCTVWIRKAWRWRGSEESPARGSEESPARSIARQSIS